MQKRDPLQIRFHCLVCRGINGAGKTTTVGKIAGRAHASGARPDWWCWIPFRAAIEQLQVWGERALQQVVTRERADPVRFCFEVVETAENKVLSWFYWILLDAFTI